MFAITACIPIVLLCLQILAGEVKPDERIQDAVALTQLRRILIVADELECNAQELRFLYHEETCSLSLINRNLVMKPGTQIVLTDLDRIAFRKDNGLVLQYERNGKTYENVIASF